MASPLDVQLQNAKTSILFMQQDHAETLQSLHQEIQKLQKKCAEMTFELAMKGDVDEEAYQVENQRLDKIIREKTIECNNLQDLVEKKERRIGVLELQLRAQEKRYTDEIKLKNLKINTIKNELDEKNGIIAVLGNEIKQMNLRSSKDNREGTVTPVPPRTSIPASRRKFSLKKPLQPHSGNVNMQGGGPVKAAHPDGMLASSNTSDDSIHNFSNPRLKEDLHRPRTPIRTMQAEAIHSKVFVLRRKERSSDEIVRRKLPLLPPIVSQGEQTSIIGSRKQNALLHQEVPGLSDSKRETLAVSSLFHKENLREVEQSNSD